MDAAPFVVDESKPKLVPGVVAKLRLVGQAQPDVVPDPTSTAGVMGLKWKRMAVSAGLEVGEMNSLRDWIEEASSRRRPAGRRDEQPAIRETIFRSQLFLTTAKKSLLGHYRRTRPRRPCRSW